METKEIVQLAAAGNINEFQSNVETEVISRLRDRIEAYKTDVTSSYSDIVEDEE